MQKINKLIRDTRYQYEKHIAIKVIVEKPDGRILLIREPETNEWMPLHWGLPGGKPLEKESLLEAFNRKMKDEIGRGVKMHGIYRIQELLIDRATVVFFIVVAKVKEDFEIEAKIANHKWISAEEIEQMDITEFSEFFNKEMLLEYLRGKKKLIDYEVVQTGKYFEMYEDPEYQKWLKSGKND